MDQFKLAEFAKVSENKENPAEFTTEVQESGIAQGSLIVSRLFNTELGEVTRVLKSWNSELTNVLSEVGLNPSALSNEQLLTAFVAIVKKYTSGLQIGDLIPNIGTTSPLGRALCNGQRLVNAKTLFPDFYDYVINSTPYKTISQWEAQKSQYGQCGFCAVDGNDIVVPLITRPISGVSNISQTGQAINDTMRPIVAELMGMNDWYYERWGTIPPTVQLANGQTVPNPAYRGGPHAATDGIRSGHGDSASKQMFDSGRIGTAYNGTETRGKQVQYPYYIQIYTGATPQSLVNTAELISLLKYQNQVGMTDLGTITGNVMLASGGIYSAQIGSNVNFVLPVPTDKGLLNQILLQLNITGEGLSIDWGTDVYFSGVPSSGIGNYNVIWEYDNLLNKWVVGQLEKVEG